LIEILKSGALDTIQDLGRVEGRRFGVGRSGAMDPVALEVGNLLLGNDPGEAGVEVAIFPFEVRFEEAVAFAVTGAGSAYLDGAPLARNWAVRARPGQTLALNASKGGVFGYITFAGGLDIPLRLGARATDLKAGFGGLAGKPLAAGDRLALRDAKAAMRAPALGYGAASSVLPDNAGPLRVIAAAEWDAFTLEAIEAFLGEPWKVGPEMNRTGYKLSGETLALNAPLELLSHGIVPGIVQVPPSGQPIVQMADANTCGGYPKLATIIAADLWRLAQTPTGQSVRFARVEWAEAVAAERALEQRLSELDAILRTARASNAA
jgi:biotin-dependent carboxylase-like uncharacterized protein